MQPRRLQPGVVEMSAGWPQGVMVPGAVFPFPAGRVLRFGVRVR